MPTYNSASYANQSGGLVRNRLDATAACGEVRIAEIEYKFGWNVVSGVAQTPEASGDILKVFQLPPSTVVLPELSGAYWEAAGSAATIVAIGDQQTANRYSTTALTLTAAGFGSITPVVATTIPRTVIVADVNDVLQVTLGGTLPATVGKRFWLRIHYRMAM